jgi:uroporphyrinogen decarboxylase
MKTLAVTRPVGEGSDTASLIRKLGWSPLIFHTVQLKPRTPSRIGHELKSIVMAGRPDWLVFMSPRGASLFFEAVQTIEDPLKETLHESHILAVGPKTEASLRQMGAKRVERPQDYSSEGIADFFSKIGVSSRRVVLARSSQASDVLEKRLIALGAKTITVGLYDSTIPDDRRTALNFLSELKSGTINATLFTSSLSATNLFEMSRGELDETELLRLLRNSLVGAIGPTTLDRLKALGLNEVLMPKHFLIEEAVSGLIGVVERKASCSPAA